MGTMATILLALSCSALLIYPIVRRMRRNGFFLAALPLAFAFGVLLPLGAPGDPVVEQLQWLPQLGLDLTFRGRSSELVRLVHPVGTQFRRPGTVARFRVF